MLDKDDLSKIERMIFSGVVDALEQVVMPRFSEIDNKIDRLDSKVDVLTEKVEGLEKTVELLDNDMGGVKMRLAVVENMMETLIDTSLVAKNHEKRIQRLEKAVL